MLISFTIKNWKSFKDSVAFSMAACQESDESEGDKRFGGRIPVLEAHGGSRILPVSAIFGGNASGKTNFVGALSFMHDMVVYESVPAAAKIRPQHAQPFLLDSDSAKRATRLTLEALADDKVYRYSLSVLGRKVTDERLQQLQGREETTLFHRKGKKLAQCDEASGVEGGESLRDVLARTDAKKTLLTTAAQSGFRAFQPLYKWFAEELMLIHLPIQPLETILTQRLLEEDRFRSVVNKILPLMDSGISRVGSSNDATGDLVAYHQDSNGNEVKFNFDQESDGTRRLLYLLPAFIMANQMKTVCVIDEIDRSLHTDLTYRLISSFLADCSATSRSQLIFTTHDAMLMDNNLLRRDEMWITQRQPDDSTDMHSLADLEESKNEPDLRSSHLIGRWGGAPLLLLQSAFSKFAGNGGKRQQASS